MIFKMWKWMAAISTAAYVRYCCRRMMRRNGFMLAATPDWRCHQCDERLDEIQRPRYVHTFSGETFKHPALVATMCARCAWVSDGSVKIPIWRWLKLRGMSTPHRDFMLRNQQRGLKVALAEVEEELKPKKRLNLHDTRLARHVHRLKRHVR